MPRLLLVTPLPPPHGGIATWSELVLEAVRPRWDVRLVNTAPPPGRMEQESVLAPERLLPSLRMLAAVVGRADVAHINTTTGFGLLRTAVMVEELALLRVPAVVHVHSGEFPARFRARRAPERALLRHALGRAAAVVSITRDTERFLRDELGLARVRWLPNFTRRRERVPQPRNATPRVLYVGAMMPAKGIFELLEAMAHVPAHLDMVGPWATSGGSDVEGPLRERVRALGLGGRVTLHGPLPRDAVLPFYERADVLALPSWREGFPLVVVEAMAAGVPVVATPVGAIPDLVRHGETGLLVPPREPAALASALQALCRDAAVRERMSVEAHRYACAHLTVEAGLAALEALWREVMRPA